MKILFLTDNFPPEVNAPATRTYEHCKEWVKKGLEVTVITCNPNFPQGKIYEGYVNRLYYKEQIDGIKVIRVWSYITANKGFLKRTLDFASYAIMAFFVGIFVKTDIIIATSPQFFTAIAGRFLALLRRKPWIMEVRDLWPESIKAVGAMRGNSWTYKILEWWELAMYRSATIIIVVTNAFKKTITQKGITPNKIKIVKNGVLLDKFKPIPKAKNLIDELGLEDKFIVGYIGTHGMAHALDFILKSALYVDNAIHFLLIGDGAEKQSLLKLKEELQLQNVTLLPFQPKSKIKNYISILDVALVNLKKSDTFKTVIPSKIFENASMEKPILLGVEGEAKEIIEFYNAGICFEPENQADFLRKLKDLFMDKQLYKKCQKGSKVLASNFDRKHLAHNMLQHIEQVARST